MHFRSGNVEDIILAHERLTNMNTIAVDQGFSVQDVPMDGDI